MYSVSMYIYVWRKCAASYDNMFDRILHVIRFERCYIMSLGLISCFELSWLAKILATF